MRQSEEAVVHKLISKNVMLVVYINKMHFTAEHEVVDKVEISRLVLVYIGLC